MASIIISAYLCLYLSVHNITFIYKLKLGMAFVHYYTSSILKSLFAFLSRLFMLNNKKCTT